MLVPLKCSSGMMKNVPQSLSKQVIIMKSENNQMSRLSYDTDHMCKGNTCSSYLSNWVN